MTKTCFSTKMIFLIVRKGPIFGSKISPSYPAYQIAAHVKCRREKLGVVSHPYFVVVIPILAIFVIFFLFVFVFVIYLINMKTTSVTVPADEITN